MDLRRRPAPVVRVRALDRSERRARDAALLRRLAWLRQIALPPPAAVIRRAKELVPGFGRSPLDRWHLTAFDATPSVTSRERDPSLTYQSGTGVALTPEADGTG